MPAPIEVTRLLQAIESFESRMPRDLPEGVAEGLTEVKRMMSELSPVRDSPGSRAAAEAAGTRGTGEHYSLAAKGPDGPSPGQREAVKAAAKEALASAGK